MSKNSIIDHQTEFGEKKYFKIPTLDLDFIKNFNIEWESHLKIKVITKKCQIGLNLDEYNNT